MHALGDLIGNMLREQGGAALLATVEEDRVTAINRREGDAARVYFETFGAMVRANRPHFTPAGRTRRPPLDPMNALLSFAYALLCQDCVAACAAALRPGGTAFFSTINRNLKSFAMAIVGVGVVTVLEITDLNLVDAIELVALETEPFADLLRRLCRPQCNRVRQHRDVMRPVSGECARLFTAQIGELPARRAGV